MLTVHCLVTRISKGKKKSDASNAREFKHKSQLLMEHRLWLIWQCARLEKSYRTLHSLSHGLRCKVHNERSVHHISLHPDSSPFISFRPLYFAGFLTKPRIFRPRPREKAPLYFVSETLRVTWMITYHRDLSNRHFGVASGSVLVGARKNPRLFGIPLSPN